MIASPSPYNTVERETTGRCRGGICFPFQNPNLLKGTRKNIILAIRCLVLTTNLPKLAFATGALSLTSLVSALPDPFLELSSSFVPEKREELDREGKDGREREREGGGEEGKGMRSLYRKLQFELDDFSAQVVVLC